MLLPPVAALSGSESSVAAAEGSEESADAASSQHARQPVKRKLSRPASDDQIALRVLLGRQCKCAKQNCFQKFGPEEQFQKLVEFRKHWAELHKLDQDKVDAC